MAKWLLTLGAMVGAAGFMVGCDHQANLPPAMDEPDSAPSAAPPPAPPPEAYLARLSPDQLQQLDTLGVDVVVPGVIPPEFLVADIQANPGRDSGPDSGPSYSIIYRDGANQCFAIEFTAGGVGDMPAVETRLPIAPPLFPNGDYGLHHGQYEDPQLRSEFPMALLYTDWLESDQGFYRLMGADYINTTLMPSGGCQDISPDMAIAIVESLTVTTADIMGEIDGG